MWDPSMCSADDLFRANVICLEKQIDDPLTQINGIVAILDMKYLGFHHIRHFSPSHAMKIVSLVQVSFSNSIIHQYSLFSSNWYLKSRSFKL